MAIKVGKISENVLKRSVLKQFSVKRPEILLGADIGEDCAALRVGEDEAIVLTTDPVSGSLEDIGELGVLGVLNDLASTGAEPVGLLITALLPEQIAEPQIREIAKQVEAQCKTYNVQMIGGHTEISRAVNEPILSVTGVGKIKEDGIITTGGASPGDDIVVTKWIGLKGTYLLASRKEAELRTRYPIGFIREAQEWKKYLCVIPEAAVAVKTGVTAMHDVTEGGIFGALWELAGASGVGLDIDIRKIPVRQETIEICEFFGINPYELVTGGSMLMASADGNRLVKALQRAGIPAAVIGKATDSNDRVLHNGEEIRYLEPAKPDAIHHVKQI